MSIIVKEIFIVKYDDVIKKLFLITLQDPTLGWQTKPGSLEEPQVV